MPKPRMMFYHDGRHPLIYMYEPPMQKEEYESAIDELAGTPMEAVMFSLGEGRTVLHDTKVGELWGHNVDKWPHLIWRRAHQNAVDLIEEGNDPLRVVCDRAHEKGMLLYASLIVEGGSDIKNEPGQTLWVRCSDFRYDNKHLEIGARGDLDANYPGFQNLDFKHMEVRDERFALIEETVNNYPVDGFELQLQNGPYFFHPDEIEAGRGIMTEWVQRVHEAVKRSGADRELVVRVPASIETCMAAGLDLREWVRQGTVDVLVGQPEGRYWVNQMEDFRPLVALAQGSDCRIQAGIQSMVDSDRTSQASIEMVRATACNYWAQGIDGLYLVHWFGNWPYQASFYEKLRELPHPDVMAPKDKSYFVPTGPGPDPEPARPGSSIQLPVTLEPNKPARLDLTVADDLPRWDRASRVHEVLLRVLVNGTTELDRLSFNLNGAELPSALLRRINQMYRMTSPRYRINNSYWFIFRLDAEHWPQQGENTLEVTLLERDPDVTPEVRVRFVEMEVKYLMGKNFHRGYVDPDLGPYEHVVS